MNKEIMECLSRIREAFPKAFINLRMELILEPKNNVYFRLGDISTELSFKRKLIEYASRSCVKGVSSYYQKQMLNGVNEFLETEFTAEEMELYIHDWVMVVTV